MKEDLKEEFFDEIKNRLLHEYEGIRVCDYLDNYRKSGMIAELTKMKSFDDLPKKETETKSFALNIDFL